MRSSGQRVGPFVLLAPLGSGGSGHVWAAVRVGQLGFTKRMALKLLRHDKLTSARARERFDREAQLGARLTHPNIRVVHELHSHEGRPYMAMQWVDTSLEELLEHAPHHRLPPEVACWIGIQCAAALSAAHAHRDAHDGACPIIHRDVAPGNILLSASGHVQLSDLAPPVDTDNDGSSSSDLRFFGNITYASPEALQRAPLDGRSDVFSLGCVLYHCLNGTPPFIADNEHSLLYQRLNDEVEDLSRRNPAVPEAIAAVVRQAMASDPAARFATADAMGEALRACVRPATAFALELQATRVIHEALGERLRAREEEMHSAYQEFSALEARTQTLPLLGRAEPMLPANHDQHSSGNPTPSGSVVTLPARRPRARGVGALLAIGLGVVAMALVLDRGQRQPAERAPPALSSPVVVEQSEHALHEKDAPPARALSIPSQAPPEASIPPPPAPVTEPPQRPPDRKPGPLRPKPEATREARPPPTANDASGTEPPRLQIERDNPYKKGLSVSAAPAAPPMPVRTSPPPP